MSRLYCNCLNTRIGYSNDIQRSRVVKIEELCSEVTEQLTGKELVEIELDVAGVSTEHSTLSQVYTLNDWKIHHCSNCNTDVYISHSVKHNKIFAFRNIVKDPSHLLKSSQYSRVFNIVLKDNDDEFIAVPRKRLSSMSYGHEDPVLKLVHSRMKSFLSQEEELMEQRIRQYEQQQREEFQKLQKRAHEERRRLFVAIYNSRETGITEAMLDHTKSQKKTNTEPVISTSTTSTVEKPPKRKPKEPEQSQMQTVTVQFQEQQVKKTTGTSDDIDDEGLFTFDEELKQTSHYQVKSSDITPFGLSSDDDDDFSTDGSSFHDDPLIKRVPSSLPMGVPMFMKQKDYEFAGSVS